MRRQSHLTRRLGPLLGGVLLIASSCGTPSHMARAKELTQRTMDAQGVSYTRIECEDDGVGNITCVARGTGLSSSDYDDYCTFTVNNHGKMAQFDASSDCYWPA